MFFSWISLDLDLRSQVISWSLLVPSCSIIFTYKKLTPPTIASGITIIRISCHALSTTAEIQTEYIKVSSAITKLYWFNINSSCREEVRIMLSYIDPEGVNSRKKNRLKRRVYSSKVDNP